MLPDDLSPAAGPADPHTEVPGSALVIGAHPDDAELGAGATLAGWAAAGCTVHLLVLTDGSKGTWDPNADPAAVASTRRTEQPRAATELGIRGEIFFGPWVDGELIADMAARRWVCAVIRRLRPDAVVAHDPWRRYRLHPDHREAATLALDAVVAARDPHFFPDLGAAHRPSQLWLFEAEDPDVVVPASVDAAAAKVAALLAHRSQWRSTMGIADEQDAVGRQRWITRVGDRLAEHGALAGVEAGEAFRLITDL